MTKREKGLFPLFVQRLYERNSVLVTSSKAKWRDLFRLRYSVVLDRGERETPYREKSGGKKRCFMQKGERTKSGEPLQQRFLGCAQDDEMRREV